MSKQHYIPQSADILATSIQCGYRGVSFSIFRDSDGWHACDRTDYLAVRLPTKAKAIEAAHKQIEKDIEARLLPRPAKG